ncbi:MAG: DUF2254 domain-containing protein [Ktedonobacterales bacterium]
MNQHRTSIQRRNSAVSLLLGSNWKQNFWLWGLPLVFFLGAFALALISLHADEAVATGKLSLPRWAISGGAGEVQTVLSVVAGASISVLTLVFSSALVVLTLAASQFGSFLLHDFMRMRISRLTLSMFVATFVYTLLILTRVDSGSSSDFVPAISAKVAVLMTFISVALLIGFIYGISVAVQAQQVAALVAGGLRRAIAERERDNAAAGSAGTLGDPVPAALIEATQRLDTEGAPVIASRSGYLQAVNFQRLVHAAAHADGVVRLAYRPGQFVLEGSTLATVWPPELADATFADEVRAAHMSGTQRTLHQDLEFAIDKLVQIALLALSSAINNTFNALICIDWLADGLRAIAVYPSDWPVYHDAGGVIRIVTHPLPFADIIAAAFSKIRYASGGNPTVIIHLVRTIATLAPFLTQPEQREALATQADDAIETALNVLTLESDRSAVLNYYDQAYKALGRPSHQEHTARSAFVPTPQP